MVWSEDTKKHLQEHLTKWPMTGQEIIETCNNMEDVPEDERDIVKEMIDPDKVYNSLDDLMADLESATPADEDDLEDKDEEKM